MSDEYIFPFHTCETPQDIGLAQPYSTAANIGTCLIILYFIGQARTLRAVLLLTSFLLFEAFHAFSHAVHVPGTMYTGITHTLAYGILGAFAWSLYQATKQRPGVLFMLFLAAIMMLDMYCFMNRSFIEYIGTTSLLLLTLLGYYYPHVSSSVQRYIQVATALTGSILWLFVNEKKHCASWLAQHPEVPYHLIIECMGAALFWVLSRTAVEL